MSNIEIYKDTKVVDVLVAQAKHEHVESDAAENAAKLIKDLASNPNPNNRYQIGQLIGFAVNEIMRPRTNWLDNLADVKRVAHGDKAQFKVRHEGIRAFIQAKGATTARSKVANKALTLDTISVSARPVINMVELQNGAVQMADLINDAAYQMELAEYQVIQNTLLNAATTWAAPYYGYGTGVVKATIDPMIRHWMRVSGGAAPIVLGDIETIGKLAELTGFTATTNTQWAEGIITEQNQTGFIGVYNGAKVVNLVNPLIDGTDNPVFDKKKLFIIPGGINPDLRPLKVVFEGDVISQDAQNIDDKTYEVRLDQFFNAAIVYGDRPYVGVYADTSN